MNEIIKIKKDEIILRVKSSDETPKGALDGVPYHRIWEECNEDGFDVLITFPKEVWRSNITKLQKWAYENNVCIYEPEIGWR